jgi:hypothetical protein
MQTNGGHNNNDDNITTTFLRAPLKNRQNTEAAGREQRKETFQRDPLTNKYL